MRTINICVFHCLACGRVVNAGLTAVPPVCCEQTMAKACEDTVCVDDVRSEVVSILRPAVRSAGNGDQSVW